MNQQVSSSIMMSGIYEVSLLLICVLTAVTSQTYKASSKGLVALPDYIPANTIALDLSQNNLGAANCLNLNGLELDTIWLQANEFT